MTKQKGVAEYRDSSALQREFPVGSRVQLHAATGDWMRGDRYGEVTGYGREREYVEAGTGAVYRQRPVLVKMDKSKKVKRFHPANLFSVDRGEDDKAPHGNPRKRRKNPVINEHAYKSIMTKFLPATNVRGSRVKAYDSDNNSVTLNYDHALDIYGNQAKAAEALQEKMGWGGDLVGGATKDGYAFNFIPETFKGRPRK